MPILVAFKSGQFAGYRPVDFAVIFLETLGIVGHPVENYELGHWYVLYRFSADCSKNTTFVPSGALPKSTSEQRVFRMAGENAGLCRTVKLRLFAKDRKNLRPATACRESP